MHGCGAGCRAVQMPIRRATRTLDSMGCTQMWRQHSLRWEKQPHLCSEPVLSHCAPLWCVDISKAAQESKPEAGTVFWFLDSFMFWNCLLINTNISRRGLLKIGNFQNEWMCLRNMQLALFVRLGMGIKPSTIANSNNDGHTHRDSSRLLK